MVVFFGAWFMLTVAILVRGRRHLFATDAS